MFQVGHSGGLCNRLDRITTGYLLARQRAENLEVIWPVNNQMLARFHDLFTELPSGQVIEGEIDSSMEQEFWAMVAALPSTYRDSESYTEMLGRVVSNAIPEVKAEVSAFVEEHFRDASPVGVHIRRLEPMIVVEELYPGISLRESKSKSPFAHELCEFAQPLRYYEAVMKSFPGSTRFFISTDSREAFRWLQTRFGDRVFQRPKMQGDRSSLAGIREGFVDLLLLSRCNAVIGTARSSFSHLAALAGRRPLVRVGAYPQVSANWPNFSWWRWMWAYRHFLVESTLWRRWLYYDVRPRAARLLRIPAKLMRTLRPEAAGSNSEAPTVAKRTSEQ